MNGNFYINEDTEYGYVAENNNICLFSGRNFIIFKMIG